jgi:hypothetical protein
MDELRLSRENFHFLVEKVEGMFTSGSLSSDGGNTSLPG